MRKNLKIVQKCGRDRFGGFRALYWAWQINKSIATIEIMKKYPKIFWKCGRRTFGRFYGVRVGAAKFFFSNSRIYILYMVGNASFCLLHTSQQIYVYPFTLRV